MKSIKTLYIYLILLLLFCGMSFAHSRDIVQSFNIQEGIVTITPGFCPPESCLQTSAVLSGTFNAEFYGNDVAFSNANISSNPESGFVLPEVPNVDSGGTSRSATFRFDGVQLVVRGVVDSRAFDGPLYEYKFNAKVSEVIGFDPNGYYLARQDNRKCILPMCGGVFVKSVNKRFTKCADGTLQDECYVASVNWQAIGFDPFNTITDIYTFTPILLKGKQIAHIYESFGNLGEFVATEAYRPATNNLPEGVFSALENNGVVCITSPCFSVDNYMLNTRRVSAISGFDLNPVGASDKDLSSAYSLFSNNFPLIAVGYNKKQQEFAGIGISFIANQFYLPVQPTLQK